jgi:hypothetical protein
MGLVLPLLAEPDQLGFINQKNQIGKGGVASRSKCFLSQPLELYQSARAVNLMN